MLVATVEVNVVVGAVTVVVAGETGYLDEQKDWAGGIPARSDATIAYIPVQVAPGVAAGPAKAGDKTKRLHSSHASSEVI